ncbi:MAG: CDP-diacylglycerol--glycerol-3-phosphate 3-phosphatidyltransferase [Nitrospinae bacterium]|nr:CDP-diacylglycerol--glycerol-3-phosphate 3-phosphatidyltransferase [Nitrospinota bacterium]
MNLPNKITLIRIFLLPLIVVLLISPSKLSSFFAVIIFVLASFTDWLDGHIARSTGQITNLGKVLDPIADKLLIVAALIPIVALGRAPAWIVVILICREFAVSGLRIIAMSQRLTIPASTIGKYKMFAQIIAIILLILNYHILFIDFFILGTIALWIALILSLISGVDYFIKFCYQTDLYME